MSGLNLIRIPVSLDALAKLSAERGWMAQKGGRGGISAEFDAGKALHHLIHESLGPTALQCFRLFLQAKGGKGSLYAYSRMNGDELRDTAAAYALTEHLNAFDAGRIECKAMPNDWKQGRILGFDVRVRPVRRLASALQTPTGKLQKGAEVDAFMSAALREHPESKTGMAKSGRTRESVYFDWLSEKMSHAAEALRENVRLAKFSRSMAVRGGRAIEGPDATLHGTLRITDPAAFDKLLTHGVGRHRSYGYGMLLLRPASRAAMNG